MGKIAPSLYKINFGQSGKWEVASEMEHFLGQDTVMYGYEQREKTFTERSWRGNACVGLLILQEGASTYKLLFLPPLLHRERTGASTTSIFAPSFILLFYPYQVNVKWINLGYKS